MNSLMFLPTWYLESFKAMIHGDNNTIDNEVENMIINSKSFFNHESLIFAMKGIDIQMERILTIFMTIDLLAISFKEEL